MVNEKFHFLAKVRCECLFQRCQVISHFLTLIINEFVDTLTNVLVHQTLVCGRNEFSLLLVVKILVIVRVIGKTQEFEDVCPQGHIALEVTLFFIDLILLRLEIFESVFKEKADKHFNLKLFAKFLVI